MQCCLINYRACKNCAAILFWRDSQAREPLLPLRIQMALDPDFVEYWLIRIRMRVSTVFEIV